MINQGSFNFNSGGHGGGALYQDASGTLAGPTRRILASQITSASSAFTNMSSTGTVSPIIVGDGHARLHRGRPGGVAVFDLSASTLTNGSLQRLKLEMNGARRRWSST